MTGFETSFAALFTARDGRAAIRRIEIPTIQRDYAQGRDDLDVERIRDAFVEVLRRAVVEGQRVNLDFVFGDLDAAEGVLQPLDGQQRLTTLFLLHWYLAARTGALEQAQAWMRFAYATRPGARSFCERLVKQPWAPDGSLPPSQWIRDLPWFLYTWEQDPTVEGMLRMLDALHGRLGPLDAEGCAQAWRRLVDADDPVVVFHLLPLELGAAAEDLYIKMNSRGKPLTEFENFKARFEQILKGALQDKAKRFAERVDGVWTDLLWPYRCKKTFTVDEAFLRYFRYVTDLCRWRGGRRSRKDGDLLALSRQVYAGLDEQAGQNTAFMLNAFDAWCGGEEQRSVAGLFDGWFTTGQRAPMDGGDARPVLFGPAGGAVKSVNLFGMCCQGYHSGGGAAFSFGHALLLYAVLLRRMDTHLADDVFVRRLRQLRNLVEASSDQVREERMPALVADAQRLVLHGELKADSTSFNRAQAREEEDKAAFLAEHPQLEAALFQLEDHPLLRGTLAAFELDADVFAQRAEAFQRLMGERRHWPDLGGALLAMGDYSRKAGSKRQFGARHHWEAWRTLLGSAGREQAAGMRRALAALLDRVSQVPGDPATELRTVQDEWLAACRERKEFGWRFHLVRYPAMRSGDSGLYAGPDEQMGYSLCMLDKERLSSYYRDPFLFAVYEECRRDGMPDIKTRVHEPRFSGYADQLRWMRLVRSEVGLCCMPQGWALRCPHPEFLEAFRQVCEGAEAHFDQDGIARHQVPQERHGEQAVDTVDRVELGARLLRSLLDAGL